MSNPYEILGVSPSATDEEVKAAYRNLAKKYHPDNYTDDSLSEFASEKMKEVNGAYDAVVAQRRAGAYGTGSNTYSTGPQNYYAGGTKYADVRNFIKNGRINDAEQILSGVPENVRDAEWYFLKGTILIKKGWTEEAHVHFQKACNMDPTNMEYQQALNYSNNSRNGVYGGYRQNTGGNSGCTSCDVCSALICTDCCCECCGGDIIPCC